MDKEGQTNDACWVGCVGWEGGGPSGMVRKIGVRLMGPRVPRAQSISNIVFTKRVHRHDEDLLGPMNCITFWREDFSL